MLRQYRKALWEAGRETRIPAPIRNNIELSATFINPTSPDLDNLLTALFQALDGKCGQGRRCSLTIARSCSFKDLGLMFH